MKTRTYKELLIILRDNLKKCIDSYGMCYAINDLFFDDIITEEECNKLNNYLDNNKPRNVRDDSYWLKAGLLKPRIEWLNKQINKL
jgi:transcriptional regulator CtsR